MHKRFPDLLADAANAAMCLLVALFGAAVIVLMRGTSVSPVVFAALCPGLFALCLFLSRQGGKASVDLPEKAGAFDRRVFFSAARLSLIVSLVYLWAFFPGGFSSDTTTQWHQLRGELPLDDWHPALHTMLLGLAARIVEHPAFVLLLQSVGYAAAVGCAVQAMARWRVPKAFCALAALYLCANPAISNIMAFPWKDCAFAISALFLFTQLFEIHCSRGAWLKGWHIPALALTLMLCAVLRHNGIALSLAAAVWLLVSCRRARKAAAVVALCFFALFSLVKGPLYGAANVEKNATPLDETIGLPMTILSHIYVNAPQSLDSDAVAFLDSMAARDVYAAHHRPGDWNETKWFVSPLPEGHHYTLVKVFSFALKAALAEPALAIEALSDLFDLPLLPAGEAFWRMSPYVDPSAEQFGFRKAHQPFFSRALNWLCRLTASPALSWLFWRPGVPLLLVMIACVCFARHRPLTALLIPASLIAYHLATALMLSSPTDFRFFLPTFMGAPLALAALFLRPQATTR